ncbi:MAG: LytTR family transcriptional regulator, partial [Rhodobacteraceae bacterium]|nr:LytTR family transcriptional regulator [Paracoccaceae bacterium]
LYRFNDIVSELPGEDGMQVHRSHWVTFQAMARVVREDGRTWLELTEGTKVPVSRKYAEKVRKKISQLSPDTKKAVN